MSAAHSAQTGLILHGMGGAHDFESLSHTAVPADADDADDLLAARAARAESGPNVSLEDVLAKYADDLAAYPDER